MVSLTPTTLGDLEQRAVLLADEDRAAAAAEAFESDASVGAIVVVDEAGHYLGFVTRARFERLLSSRFGRAVALARTLQKTLGLLQATDLPLSPSTPIPEAVRLLLRRPSERLHEPLPIGTGRVVEAYVDPHDILTAHAAAAARQAEELDRQRIALEAAQQAKERFLACVSHELRTPLTAIIGRAELLDREHGDVDLVREHASGILAAGGELERLVVGLLDLTAIDCAHLVPHLVAESPVELVASVADGFRRLAGGKGLEIEVIAGAGVPTAVLLDVTRTQQIVGELVGNALKFTDRGLVHVRVLRGGDRLRIEVQDEGNGMDADQLERAFLPLTRNDDSLTRVAGGAGIGLTLARRVAEALGGTIEASSEPDVGSTFTLVLPLIVGTQQSAPSPAPESLAAKVLYAEDVPANQLIVRRFLESAGCEVEVAEDGAVAVDAWSRAQEAGHPFDLVLMDVQMPVMDGHGATRELRRRGAQHPIVALTAHDRAEDRDAAFDAGCSGFLTKPIRRADLLTELLSQLKRSPTAA